jgi:hypothetical protein
MTSRVVVRAFGGGIEQECLRLLPESEQLDQWRAEHHPQNGAADMASSPSAPENDFPARRPLWPTAGSRYSGVSLAGVPRSGRACRPPDFS